MRAVIIALVAVVTSCKTGTDATPPPPSASAPASASASALAPAPASASALASASASAAPAPSLKSFPGTEAGAKLLVTEFVKPGADAAGLSKQLRPTSADYKSLFDAPTAAKLDATYSKEWDRGTFIVVPGQGQTEVKIVSATVADFKGATPKTKDFPAGYKKIASHLVGSATLYRFHFLEPGKEQGNSYDGLTYVNGHWALFPKPWRGLDDH